VFILARFIKSTRPTKKLSEKYLGPFKVIRKLDTHLYLIKLPNYLHAIYLVFHILQIEPVPLNNIPNYINSSPSPIKINGNLEFEIV